MRQYWRGALVLLLFVVLGLALWIALYRIWVDGPQTEGAVSLPTLGATATSVTGATTLDRLTGAIVPAADPYDLARRLRGWQPAGQVPISTPTTPLVAGFRDTFHVLDLASSRAYEVEATLRYAGPLSFFWVEDGIDVSDAAVLRSARVFESEIYPTVATEFGVVTGAGASGQFPVTILNLRLRGAAGYFSSSDLYPSSVVPSSNERAMFYMAAGGGEVGSDSYNSTLAHELQHMIHWQADSNEESWVSEGYSELAEFLCGYPKLNRIATFTGHSDIALGQWSADDATTSQHYSAAFLFSTYYSQRFGPDAVQRLVLDELNGMSGYDSVLTALGSGLTFEDLFADWVVTNYVDGPGATKPPWRYEGLDVSVRPQSTIAEYPAKIEGTVGPFGSDYIELAGDGREVELLFDAEEDARLVPTIARSGTHFWWSNRGDNSDMTLTRGFNLSGLSGAHLQVSLWYDIEDGWDYAYIEASPDGGETWRLLPGLHTTLRDPTGQSFGPAYTGRSTQDSSTTTVWLEEVVDLSEFAGKEVVIRFEYVTDDAVSQSGLCIDDIRIPELSYSHDAENGDDGWVGRGFVRVDNSIPRRYLLQTFAVKAGELQLERTWIESGRDTRLTVITPAVVAISDVTRFAENPARYALSAQAQQ